MRKNAGYREPGDLPVDVSAIDPIDGDFFHGDDKADELRVFQNYVRTPDHDGPDEVLKKASLAAVEASAQHHLPDIQAGSEPMRMLIARARAARLYGMTAQEFYAGFYGGRQLQAPEKLASLGFDLDARFLQTASRREYNPPLPQHCQQAHLVQAIDGIYAQLRRRPEFKERAAKFRALVEAINLEQAKPFYQQLVQAVDQACSKLTIMPQKRAGLVTAAYEAVQDDMLFWLRRAFNYLKAVFDYQQDQQIAQDHAERTARRFTRDGQVDWIKEGEYGAPDPQVGGPTVSPTGSPSQTLKDGDEVIDNLGNHGSVTEANPDGTFRVVYQQGPAKDVHYNADASQSGVVKRAAKEVLTITSVGTGRDLYSGKEYPSAQGVDADGEVYDIFDFPADLKVGDRVIVKLDQGEESDAKFLKRASPENTDMQHVNQMEFTDLVDSGQPGVDDAHKSNSSMGGSGGLSSTEAMMDLSEVFDT